MGLLGKRCTSLDPTGTGYCGLHYGRIRSTTSFLFLIYCARPRLARYLTAGSRKDANLDKLPCRVRLIIISYPAFERKFGEIKGRGVEREGLNVTWRHASCAIARIDRMDRSSPVYGMGSRLTHESESSGRETDHKHGHRLSGFGHWVMCPLPRHGARGRGEQPGQSGWHNVVDEAPPGHDQAHDHGQVSTNHSIPCLALGHCGAQTRLNW